MNVYREPSPPPRDPPAALEPQPRFAVACDDEPIEPVVAGVSGEPDERKFLSPRAQAALSASVLLGMAAMFLLADR